VKVTATIICQQNSTWAQDLDLDYLEAIFPVHLTLAHGGADKRKHSLNGAAVVPEFTEPKNWPRNSPDLKPVDYSVWEALQQMVYVTKFQTLTG